MRVAAIYDIHGNLPALEAVLRDVRAAAPDVVVVGGDVLPGPMPRECLDCLRAFEPAVRCLQGNGEREVLAERRGEPSGVPEQFREPVQWVAGQLTDDDERWISSWPSTQRLDVAGVGPVLFCHATPRSDREIFTRRTPEAVLRPVFADVEAAIVVCGHTHMPFDRTVGVVRVVNAGSVGMPFGAPGADWVLLDGGILPRRTVYDVSEAVRRIAGTAYPGARDFASQHVVSPPAEAEMLERFTRAGIG